MTDKQINIAIAEVCGWTDCGVLDDGRSFGLPTGVTSINGRYSPIPDYCNDLNAMHEAEQVLTDDQYHTGYKQTLSTIVGLAGNMRTFSATARQRAEAFLKTIKE